MLKMLFTIAGVVLNSGKANGRIAAFLLFKVFISFYYCAAIDQIKFCTLQR